MESVGRISGTRQQGSVAEIILYKGARTISLQISCESTSRFDIGRIFLDKEGATALAKGILDAVNEMRPEHVVAVTNHPDYDFTQEMWHSDEDKII